VDSPACRRPRRARREFEVAAAGLAGAAQSGPGGGARGTTLSTPTPFSPYCRMMWSGTAARRARAAEPCRRRSTGHTRRTVSTGTAKPTRRKRRWTQDGGVDADHAPEESRSGPPELPGLIAASVWITSWIWLRLMETMLRPRALTTPTLRTCPGERVADRERGLATAGPEEPVPRTRTDFGASILRTATS